MKNTALLLFCIFLIILSSCKKDDKTESNIDSGLAKNTVKIENSDWQNNIIDIDTTSYSIRFNKNVLKKYSINKGDIIVGTEEGGFLRKVKDISIVGNEVLIKTEFAAITDAFKELTEQTSVSLIPDKESKDFWLVEGVELNSLKSTSANLMTFSINSILYDLDGNSSTKTDQVRISGSYSLDANFDINIDIKDFELSKLMLKYNINQNKVIDGYLGVGGFEISKKKKLATIPCGEILAGPVIIEPIIDIYAGFAINLSTPLQTKIEQNYNSLTTIYFQNGEWKTEKSITENEVFEKPNISGVLDAKLYLNPVLRFKVYRTVSPYIDAELSGSTNVTLKSNLLNWKTSVGLNMNAGVNMMIWNHTLFDFSTNLFSWEHILAEGEERPKININNTTWDVTLNLNNSSSWHADVTFFEDGTTKYDEPEYPGVYLTYGKWSLNGDQIQWNIGLKDSYTFNGKVNENTMTGEWIYVGPEKRTWTAVRRQ